MSFHIHNHYSRYILLNMKKVCRRWIRVRPEERRQLHQQEKGNSFFKYCQNNEKLGQLDIIKVLRRYITGYH